MKSKIFRLLTSLVFFAGATWAAAQGNTFTYQGQLTANGTPVNGIYDLQFIVYNASVGGDQIGVTVTDLATPVSGGVFTVELNFGAGIFTGNTNWLDIAVRPNGGSTFNDLSPRQQLTPVPYAIFAATSSNLSGTVNVKQLNGTVANSQLANNSITVTAGTGLSGGGVAALGGATTLANAGVVSLAGNGDITVSTATGAVTLGDTATSADTTGTIVKRDSLGDFSAGTITANLDGNALAATTATSFSGSLTGDVTGTQNSTVVSSVGGQTAANVANATYVANSATSANGSYTLVERDDLGNFLAEGIGLGGVGTLQQTLSIGGGLNIDQGDQNTGVLNSPNIGSAGSVGLSFGSDSGEGIASQRTASTNGTQYDLVFFTDFDPDDHS